MRRGRQHDEHGQARDKAGHHRICEEFDEPCCRAARRCRRKVCEVATEDDELRLARGCGGISGHGSAGARAKAERGGEGDVSSVGTGRRQRGDKLPRVGAAEWPGCDAAHARAGDEGGNVAAVVGASHTSAANPWGCRGWRRRQVQSRQRREKGSDGRVRELQAWRLDNILAGGEVVVSGCARAAPGAATRQPGRRLRRRGRVAAGVDVVCIVTAAAVGGGALVLAAAARRATCIRRRQLKHRLARGGAARGRLGGRRVLPCGRFGR